MSGAWVQYVDLPILIKKVLVFTSGKIAKLFSKNRFFLLFLVPVFQLLCGIDDIQSGIISGSTSPLQQAQFFLLQP